ncbi:hypothetical protein D3C75_1220800 [compost metagenome]
MKEIFECVNNIGVGIIIGLLLGFVITWNWPTDTQVGKTWSEINSLKELCEYDLPRNIECVPQIVMVKKNKEDKE